LIGDYDYAFLFKPNLPFMKKSRRAAPFFGLDDKMPIMLAMLLGLQHALAMLAGGMFIGEKADRDRRDVV
jgi:NCS2 family nucleobase:cation symporter-2